MPVKSKVKILENFVAFSVYMNFIKPDFLEFPVSKNIYLTPMFSKLVFRFRLFWIDLNSLSSQKIISERVAVSDSVPGAININEYS